MCPKSVLRISVLLVAVVGIAFAAEDTPPELTAVRAEFEARLAVPRAKLEAVVKARVARYVSDLKELETKVSAAGQLDAVVLIGAEREAYARDARTNGFLAGNAKVPAAARQLRAAFEADLARARATVAPEGRAAATEYLRVLGELERKLTCQKAATPALAVRKEREETQVDGLDPLNPPGAGLIGD
jgi:hypothetical protein